MALILFDFEESDTILIFTCSGVFPMIANARMTDPGATSLPYCYANYLKDTNKLIEVIGANDIKRH